MRSCMMVFIRVLVPPLPWEGRREAPMSGLVPGAGLRGGGRTGTLEGAPRGGVARGAAARSKGLAPVGAWKAQPALGEQRLPGTPAARGWEGPVGTGRTEGKDDGQRAEAE